jgi:hypothetical protein
VGGDYSVAATGGASGNPVLFSSLTTSVCTTSGSTASLISTGTCTIAADQAGGDAFSAAPQATQSFTVNKGSQSIAFTSIPVSPTFGGHYTVSASGGASGNPVTFSSLTPGVCTVSGDNVSFVSAGSCSIAANQDGSSNYYAATQLVQTFVIAKATQTLSFNSTVPSPAILGTIYGVSATSSAGFEVTFTTSGSCSNTGASVTLATVGSCTVTAHANGSTNYLNADGPSQTFNVIFAFTGFGPDGTVHRANFQFK